MAEKSIDHDGKAKLLVEAGELALQGKHEDGKQLVALNWPHVTRVRSRRAATPRQRFRVFCADGFRCRYSGELLLFPAFMTTLSTLWPDTFPAHPNGKTEEAHDAYWTHFPSVEHVQPVAIGGLGTENNWITTSMARNQVRSRYPLELLNWEIRPREILPDWDGGVRHFLDLIEKHPQVLQDSRWGSYLENWNKIARTETAH